MKIYLLFALMPFISNCQQQPVKTENQQNMMNTNSQILTRKNYVDVMSNKIKKYPTEPYYFLEIENILGCTYEIFVNDMPVFKYYSDKQLSSQIDIQWYLLKSGPQKITYKLYPIGKRENGDRIDELLDWTKFEINLLSIDKSKPNPYMSKKVLMEYKAPNNSQNNKFVGSGQKFYESIFTFNAKLPYENAGWSRSMDLRKIDRSKLLKMTVSAYTDMWNLINDKKEDAFLSCFYKKEVESSQSEYSHQEDLSGDLEAYLKPFSESSFKLEPIQDYKLCIYGDGKIAALELNSADIRMKGKSALWGTYKNAAGSTIGNFRKLYLHIPKGKTAFEIIR